MDTQALFPPIVQQALAVGITLLGAMALWRGLQGGPGGRQSLVRRKVIMIDRLEGWRFTIVGLTLIGIGVAWLTGSRGLLVLSLGIGFVELHEATHIMRAWRWSGDLSRRSPSASQQSLMKQEQMRALERTA